MTAIPAPPPERQGIRQLHNRELSYLVKDPEPPRNDGTATPPQHAKPPETPAETAPTAAAVIPIEHAKPPETPAPTAPTDAAKSTDAAKFWNLCVESLQEKVSGGVWQSTFRDVQPLDTDEGYFRVSVPSSVVRTRIDRSYRSLVEDILGEVIGEQVHLLIDLAPAPPAAPEVVLEDVPPEDDLAPPDAGGHRHYGAMPTQAETVVAGASGDGAESWSDVFDEERLNPRYTFEQFVCGPSNSFTHAAALRVAEQPGEVYNPLFVYGDAGLGKTHLLHAIAHYVHQHYPTRLVRLVSTETFLNRFVAAIRSNQMPKFKEHFRRANVLLIDDAQFFARKEGLQEEFFHTFNRLHENNSQLVITADCQPDAVPTIEDRLRTRFKWGLITDIQPPNIETRLAILERRVPLAAQQYIGPKVLEYIAERVPSNIRELEGALNRVVAFATLQEPEKRVPVSVATAQDLLRDLFATTPPPVMTPQTILAATATMYGITIDELIGPSRRRQLVTARHVAMYVMRELTDLSFPAIAEEFGGRDHTTVIHAVNKITALMQEKQEIYEQVTQLIRILRNGQHGIPRTGP